MKNYTVDELLANYHLMDKFIHELANYEITNMDGGSYRQVCLAYYKDGVLLQSDHHTNDTCYVMIASNPKAKISKGEQNSRYNGNPRPTLSEGGWVVVWSKYINDLQKGPWENKVREVIQFAIDKLNLAIQKKVETEQKLLKERLAEEGGKRRELIRNWSF